jgi:integrase
MPGQQGSRRPVPAAFKETLALAAGITASISPHTLRHFLFAWLKTQGIDDALIQPCSGHATRQSLEIYSRLALADAPQRTTTSSATSPSKSTLACPW